MLPAILIAVMGFLFLTSPALAVTVTISNVPSSITSEPFSFNVSVSSAQSSTTNYLRANLFPPSTTNYFGYTQNGSSYVNSSTYSDYLPIPIDSSGNWSGSILAKLDPNSSYYSGSGTYNLKVRRYTQSGSSYTWSDEAILTINYSSTPSPSPSPSSTSSTVSTFTISGVPSEIDSAQNFKVNINLSLPNNQTTEYYLKGAFKKVGATRYFGMTKVGSSWINYGSDLSNQFKITTNSSGQWSGDIEVQPDVLDNDYEGTGDYVFKVARYTTSNSLSWSNEANIKINAKEVEDQGGVIDLSKLSSKETPKVLGETKKEDEKLPDSVYSLENYRRSATISSTPSSSLIEIKSQKQNLFFPIAGGILLGLGLGFGAYLIIKNRVK